jgi:hypothetical protein
LSNLILKLLKKKSRRQKSHIRMDLLWQTKKLIPRTLWVTPQTKMRKKRKRLLNLFQLSLHLLKI